MKKIIGLTIVGLLIIGLVGVGTWAAFIDVEISSGNTFTAGTLDLTPNESSISVISYNDVYPGWSNVSGGIHSDSWTLTNSGSIDGDLTILIGTIDEDDHGQEDPENDQSTDTGTGDLGGQLDIVFWADLDGEGDIDGGVWSDGNTNGYMDAGEGEIMFSSKLNAMPATYPVSGKIDLNNGASIDVYFDASIALGVDNRIMGDSSTFNITFQLNQTP